MEPNIRRPFNPQPHHLCPPVTASYCRTCRLVLSGRITVRPHSAYAGPGTKRDQSIHAQDADHVLHSADTPRASLGIPRRCSPPLSRLHIRFGGRSSGASSTESLLNYDRASHWVPYCLPTPHCARHCPCNEYDALMNSDVLHPEP